MEGEREMRDGRRERDREVQERVKKGERKVSGLYSRVELVLLTQGWLSAGSSFLARHSADAATSDGR